MPGSAEKELEEFLASKALWMRRTFETGFPSLSQAEKTEWWNNAAEVHKLTTEYEQILQQLPVKWREYRKRRKREAYEAAQIQARYSVPKGNPGAPPKDDLARNAALLQQLGMNFPQIAFELNKTLGDGNKTTADAVRKL